MSLEKHSRQTTPTQEVLHWEFDNVLSAVAQAGIQREKLPSAVSGLAKLVSSHGHKTVAEVMARVIEKPHLLSVNVGSREARASFITALGRLKDSRFLDFMHEHGLRHESPNIKVTTLQALGQMGQKASPMLAELRRLEKIEGNSHLKRQMQMAISRIARELEPKRLQLRPSKPRRGIIARLFARRHV